MADIFELLNKFNLRLQEPDTNNIQFKDVLSGLVEKIQNWNRKVNQGNFAMFEKLSEFEADSLSAQIKQEISEHLRSLEKEFQRYFPDLDEGFVTFPRNSFSLAMDIATVPEEVQEELLDLRNDSASREMFMEKWISQFWCSMQQSYPKLLTEALRVIVPFASTYICETGFSALVQNISKARNQPNVEIDISITSRFPKHNRLFQNLLLINNNRNPVKCIVLK